MRKHYGVLATLLSAFIFGFTPILAKWTYVGGSNAISLTFYRSFMALPVLYIILNSRGVSLKITKKEVMHLLMVGGLGQALTTLTLYASYDYLSVGMATTLHFIYPIFVVLVGVLYYHESWSPAKIIAIGLAIFGMLTFIDQTGDISFIGVFLAFLSGVTYAFYILYIDKSGLKQMDPFKLTFYLSLVVSICVFIYGTSTQTLAFSLTPWSWFLTLMIALLVTVGAVALLQIGIRLIGSTKASILCLAEPITSVVCGVVLLNEQLSIMKLIGCAFILLSSYAITKDKKKYLTSVRCFFMHDRDRQVPSFSHGKIREYEGGSTMKNPKSFTTFLEGFNLGAILALISLGGALLNSQTIQIYSLILILIVTNGIVVGVVRQYLLIQLTLTKNMTRSFKQSKNQVPGRLLEMRNYKLADTLKLLVGISARLRMNMCGVVVLMLLLLLTLFLPTIYTYRLASDMMMFSLMWSFIFIIYTFKIIGEINHNYHYLQNQITYLLEIHQFNRAEMRQKQS